MVIVKLLDRDAKRIRKYVSNQSDLCVFKLSIDIKSEIQWTFLLKLGWRSTLTNVLVFHQAENSRIGVTLLCRYVIPAASKSNKSLLKLCHASHVPSRQ